MSKNNILNLESPIKKLIIILDTALIFLNRALKDNTYNNLVYASEKLQNAIDVASMLDIKQNSIKTLIILSCIKLLKAKSLKNNQMFNVINEVISSISMINNVLNNK